MKRKKGLPLKKITLRNLDEAFLMDIAAGVSQAPCPSLVSIGCNTNCAGCKGNTPVTSAGDETCALGCGATAGYPPCAG